MHARAIERLSLLLMLLVLGACERSAPSVDAATPAKTQTESKSTPPVPSSLAVEQARDNPNTNNQPVPPPSPDKGEQSPPASAAPSYSVQCDDKALAAEACRVDANTYVGWRTFAAQCQVCHGGSALGSTFAPNLLDRLNQRVDYPRFIDVVTNGYRGQIGAMPAWRGNSQVIPHIDDLYRYLRARADGKLPPGRPQRLPK